MWRWTMVTLVGRRWADQQIVIGIGINQGMMEGHPLNLPPAKLSLDKSRSRTKLRARSFCQNGKAEVEI